MKTIFAIVCYCIAIGFLVVCAAVIVVKLVFWPPCTQIGNACVIDPWSTAGLAGTVLAVAATVLAILGAVSVAAWWTSLNTTVTERVKKLYKKQQREVNTQVDTMLAGQREKVDVQLEEFQTAFQSLEASESILRKRIDLLHKSTQDVEEMAIDGITSVFDAGFMEQWAQKATQGQRFPRIVLKMAENYLNAVEFRLPQVEEELTNVATILKSHEDFHKKHFQNVTYTSVMNASSLASLQNLHFEISNILKDLTKEYSPLSDTFTNWDGALRWFGTGMDYTEFVLPDGEAFMVTLTKLKERVEEFRPRIEQLKQNRELLIAEATKFLLYITTDIESIDEEINAPKETQG